MSSNRFTIQPAKDIELWDYYKKHVASFWTMEEIDLGTDKEDWDKLDLNEKHFIKSILAFFASADGIVNENLVLNFYKEVESPEARAFYSFQIAAETIHSETYSILLEFLVDDKNEQSQLFNAIETLPVVKKKAEWAFNYFQNEIPFAKRLVAFACIEGIFFSGSFCALFWLKKRGLMKGLTFSNELISRDEGLHCDFACALYRRLPSKLSYEEIIEIVESAVNSEVEFICYALPCNLIGMCATKMEEYIKFVADRLITLLGSKPYYNAQNPFDFMDMISLQGKTNFFERRVGEYQKAGVLTGSNPSFSLDDDF